MAGTEANAELETLARRLADAHPPAAAREILLVGSVARGEADELSDLELLVVEPAARTEAECRAWLEGLGAGDLAAAVVEGGRVWVSGRVDGRATEVLWCPLDAIEADLDRILAGDELRHDRLMLADALVHAAPLRTDGRLDGWRSQLATYPDLVRERLVADAASGWGIYVPEPKLTVTRPGERLDLVRELVDVCERVLRILYALDRRWETGWKRLPAVLAPVALKPERTPARIEAALSESDSQRALRLAYELAAETLDLVPSELDVARARRWTRELLELLA